MVGTVPLREAVESIFISRLTTLTAVDQVVQVRVEVLDLLAELFDIVSRIFTVILRVRLLPPAVVILLSYLVKHADLPVELLDGLPLRCPCPWLLLLNYLALLGLLLNSAIIVRRGAIAFVRVAVDFLLYSLRHLLCLHMTAEGIYLGSI